MRRGAVPLIGLTGGYASGKNLVASVFRRLGGTVIDLDIVSRRVVEPGSAGFEEARKAFGDRIVTPEGQLDRRALGAIVFADPVARERLEAILHPLIRQVAFAEAETVLTTDPSAGVVVDGALLFEAGWHRELAATALVVAGRENQIVRGAVRDRISTDEAAQRVAAQWPDERKRPLADAVIDNSGDRKKAVVEAETAWRRRVRGEKV